MGLNTKTATEIKDLLDRREISARDVTQSVLDAIESTDDKVKSYILVDGEGALKRADEIDAIIAKGGETGPLGGIPISVKDIFSVKGQETTAGSKILKGYIPPYDATSVRKSLEAGAIHVGKVNMDEFAMGSSTENSAYHITHNPWDLERIPGGSSGSTKTHVLRLYDLP